MLLLLLLLLQQTLVLLQATNVYYLPRNIEENNSTVKISIIQLFIFFLIVLMNYFNHSLYPPIKYSSIHLNWPNYFHLVIFIIIQLWVLMTMPLVSDGGQKHLTIDSLTNNCDLLGLSFKLPLILRNGHQSKFIQFS